MQEQVSIIIEKARDLAGAIREHEITKRYNECRADMNGDRKARDLHSRLVAMGREINEKIARGETIGPEPSSEHEFMRQELENNRLVKDYIQSQKEYLDLLKSVIERIKNPSARE
ncbi:MAG TPA: YlbF family regulator [Spirochaetota bacterium]|nr:YlbF family regulator [Spirochaetota bacterium]HOD14339.1 YlbF family regulator [Spirochaetota bacterium]HPG50783.1 YlbF family regulator [Spirochaetota bacterium]HQL84000.1 YlbF family regulator [Spirochaetota bacterium]